MFLSLFFSMISSPTFISTVLPNISSDSTAIRLCLSIFRMAPSIPWRGPLVICTWSPSMIPWESRTSCSLSPPMRISSSTSWSVRGTMVSPVPMIRVMPMTCFRFSIRGSRFSAITTTGLAGGLL